MLGEKYNPDFNKDGFQIYIEPINPDDWEKYRDFRLLGLREEPIAFEDPANGEKRITSRGENEWRNILQGKVAGFPDSSRISLWAKEGNEPAGTLNATISNSREDGKAAFIQNVYVPKQYRGRGISRKLMAEMISKLETVENLHKIELEVFSTQGAAIKLYESFGFKIVKHNKDFKVYDGKAIDKYEMEREVQQPS
jgi:ribosomal protein S18 acetylase RimI-like enzyme